MTYLVLTFRFSFVKGNIDVWVGCMAEDVIEGGKVGPTFRCLVSFQNLKNMCASKFFIVLNTC